MRDSCSSSSPVPVVVGEGWEAESFQVPQWWNQGRTRETMAPHHCYHPSSEASVSSAGVCVGFPCGEGSAAQGSTKASPPPIS